MDERVGAGFAVSGVDVLCGSLDHPIRSIGGCPRSADEHPGPSTPGPSVPGGKVLATVPLPSPTATFGDPNYYDTPAQEAALAAVNQVAKGHQAVGMWRASETGVIVRLGRGDSPDGLPSKVSGFTVEYRSSRMTRAEIDSIEARVRSLAAETHSELGMYYDAEGDQVHLDGAFDQRFLDAFKGDDRVLMRVGQVTR